MYRNYILCTHEYILCMHSGIQSFFIAFFLKRWMKPTFYHVIKIVTFFSLLRVIWKCVFFAFSSKQPQQQRWSIGTAWLILTFYFLKHILCTLNIARCFQHHIFKFLWTMIEKYNFICHINFTSNHYNVFRIMSEKGILL